MVERSRGQNNQVANAWKAIADRYAENARRKALVDTLIASIVADRVSGLSFGEIAARHGVSIHAAKKYHLDATSGYWRPGKHEVGLAGWQDVGDATPIMDLPVAAELREVLAIEFAQVRDLIRLRADVLKAKLKRLPTVGPQRQAEVIALVMFVEAQSTA